MTTPNVEMDSKKRAFVSFVNNIPNEAFRVQGSAPWEFTSRQIDKPEFRLKYHGNNNDNGTHGEDHVHKLVAYMFHPADAIDQGGPGTGGNSGNTTVLATVARCQATENATPDQIRRALIEGYGGPYRRTNWKCGYAPPDERLPHPRLLRPAQYQAEG